MTPVSSVSLLSFDCASLDKFCTKLERGLQLPAYVPILSVFPGAIRQVYGLAQIVGSISVVSFKLIQLLFVDEHKRDELVKKSWQILKYSYHGLANIVRGIIETIPLVNFIFYFYDQCGRLRMTYDKEEVSEAVNPLFRKSFLFNFRALDRGFKGIERSLNNWGRIPFVSAFSGMLRQFYGTVQLVASVATIIFNGFRIIAARTNREKKELWDDNKRLVVYGWHGLANIVRGQIESIPFFNLLLFPYDRSGRRWKYKHEEAQPILPPNLRRVVSLHF